MMCATVFFFAAVLQCGKRVPHYHLAGWPAGTGVLCGYLEIIFWIEVYSTSFRAPARFPPKGNCKIT